MPTDDEQENDHMTAATVENQSTPDPFKVTPEFKARIAKHMQSVPVHPDEAQDAAADHLEQKQRVRQEAWANSLHAASVDALAQWRLEQLADYQHPAALRKYVAGIGDGQRVKTLVMGGRAGAGKTSAGIACGNAAVARGLMARFVRHATYLKWLRPDGSPADLQDWQIRARFRACDLLVLDDLGAEIDPTKAASQFVRDETLSLLGDRIESGKATIITTNETPDSLALTLGDRLLSRLSDHGFALTFTGPDQRGPRLSW